MLSKIAWVNRYGGSHSVRVHKDRQKQNVRSELVEVVGSTLLLEPLIEIALFGSGPCASSPVP